MRTGRRATLALLALLLGLLLPAPSHAAGTPTARVSSYLSDAVPAALPAPRPHADLTTAPDALAPDAGPPVPATTATATAAPDGRPRPIDHDDVTARGPPQA